MSRVVTLSPRWRSTAARRVVLRRFVSSQARSRPAPHPEDAEHEGADADDPDDQSLAHRPDAADAGAARVRLALDGLDVVDDRALLLGGQLVVPEDRHVL